MATLIMLIYSHVFLLFFIAEWWNLYGIDAPNLRRVAVRILSQTASAGGCERNWSTFNLIHSKRRNRLGSKRLMDLVYVHYNLRLKMQHAREGENRSKYLDPIDVAYIFSGRGDDDEEGEDILQAWLNKNAPTLDEHDGPSEHIAEEMGADVHDFRRSQSGRSRVVGPIEGHPPSPYDDPIAFSQSQSQTKSQSSSSDKSGGGGDNDNDVHMLDDEEDDDQDEGPPLVRHRGGYGESEFVAGMDTRNVHGQQVPSPLEDEISWTLMQLLIHFLGLDIPPMVVTIWSQELLLIHHLPQPNGHNLFQVPRPQPHITTMVMKRVLFHAWVCFSMLQNLNIKGMSGITLNITVVT